jgi:RHH-type proline utilization regulon transcriptional repressor/proline dehydrogenase/delta 1-pyrroline-5-carboxylate dehydrogenase
MLGNWHDVVSPAGRRINPYYLSDEARLVADFCRVADCSPALRDEIARTAERLVRAVRRHRRSTSGVDALLHQYPLSSAEGVALMCLTEALLRIPDAATADALIADRLQAGDWSGHLADSDSLFVNASTWALMLTGELLQPDARAVENPAGFLRALMARLGEPLVRAAMRHAMRVIADQFVMGRDIDAAIARVRAGAACRYRYSFDMLGEAALTAADAQRYFDAYHEAIGKLCAAWAGATERPSVSVKLSALHPRFEPSQRATALALLTARVAALAHTARGSDVALTLDAEESATLELQLEVFAAVLRDAALRGWDGFGLAVQAYQRRAMAVLGWLDDLAGETGHRVPVRLVKGAYWDMEISLAQQGGLASYPVFTRKVNTDVSYLACARRLLESNSGRLYPQFATHNAHTVAWLVHVAGGEGRFEFQRLHGMGEVLYDELLSSMPAVGCRVYAPVGDHVDLLPYLVRRLLENGANSSFVNRIVQDEVPIGEVVADPVQHARQLGIGPDPSLPAPADLFGASRRNSTGINLADSLAVEALGAELGAFGDAVYGAKPLIDGAYQPGQAHPVRGAGDPSILGTVEFASAAQVDAAVAGALAAYPAWSASPVAARGAVLRRAADLVEAARAELVALCVREAGRCVADALDEVRETVDLLRYYAVEAEQLMARPVLLPGPAGERNELRLRGRGVFACISPWNFPLAIFAGQVAAALVTGNSVVAKPAEQTSLIAARMLLIWRQAGVPDGVLQFLPGDGDRVGARLAADPRVAGIVFTGATGTARSIQRALADGAGPGAVLIAETGGLNALVADSSALPEQLVRDVVRSAFNSAGQRCSALRVLLLQEDIAPRVIELLRGRMAKMRLGNPADLATDVGPVIDEAALAALERVRARRREQRRILYECPLPEDSKSLRLFPPLLVEIDDIAELQEEVFGPVLHLARFPASAWPAVLDAINATGYGLTCGLHSRVERRMREFSERVLAGNVYINRNLIGAVVGVQPFGGRGLSGSGPKAGGPNYLVHFVTEQTVTTNTAAIGGNVQLLAHSPQ